MCQVLWIFIMKFDSQLRISLDSLMIKQIESRRSSLLIDVRIVFETTNFFFVWIFARCLHALNWWLLHSFDCMHQWIDLFSLLVLRAVVCDSICSLRSIWAKDISCSVDLLTVEDSRIDVNRLDQRVAHSLYHFSFLYLRLHSQIVEIVSSCLFELTQVAFRLERSWRHWWSMRFWLKLRSWKTRASRRRTASICDNDQSSFACNHSARDSHCFIHLDCFSEANAACNSFNDDRSSHLYQLRRLFAFLSRFCFDFIQFI